MNINLLLFYIISKTVIANIKKVFIASLKSGCLRDLGLKVVARVRQTIMHMFINIPQREGGIIIIT
jgi:hypothetical protein